MRCVLLLSVLLSLGADTAGAQFKAVRSLVVGGRGIDSLKQYDYAVDETSPILTHNFLENTIVAGGTLGTPGGLNVIVGGYYDRISLRLEAGGLPFLFLLAAGYQVDAGFVLARGSNYLVECSATYTRTWLIGGSAAGPRESEWSGIGPGLTLEVAGFFLQAGVGHILGSSGVINAVPMTVQIGYVR